MYIFLLLKKCIYPFLTIRYLCAGAVSGLRNYLYYCQTIIDRHNAAFSCSFICKDKAVQFFGKHS